MCIRDRSSQSVKSVSQISQAVSQSSQSVTRRPPAKVGALVFYFPQGSASLRGALFLPHPEPGFDNKRMGNTRRTAIRPPQKVRQVNATANMLGSSSVQDHRQKPELRIGPKRATPNVAHHASKPLAHAGTHTPSYLVNPRLSGRLFDRHPFTTLRSASRDNCRSSTGSGPATIPGQQCPDDKIYT